MGFLDTLKEKLQEGRDKLALEVGRFRNKTFLDSVVSAAVIIAAAVLSPLLPFLSSLSILASGAGVVILF